MMMARFDSDCLNPSLFAYHRDSAYPEPSCLFDGSNDEREIDTMFDGGIEDR